MRKQYFIKVLFCDGTIIETRINGTYQEVIDYYSPGKLFNLGDGPYDYLQRVDRILSIDEISD